jgi:hypothetical protein
MSADGQAQTGPGWSHASCPPPLLVLDRDEPVRTHRSSPAECARLRRPVPRCSRGSRALAAGERRRDLYDDRRADPRTTHVGRRSPRRPGQRDRWADGSGTTRLEELAARGDHGAAGQVAQPGAGARGELRRDAPAGRPLRHRPPPDLADRARGPAVRRVPTQPSYGVRVAGGGRPAATHHPRAAGHGDRPDAPFALGQAVQAHAGPGRGGCPFRRRDACGSDVPRPRTPDPRPADSPGRRARPHSLRRRAVAAAGRQARDPRGGRRVPHGGRPVGGRHHPRA